jgi:hypothetical protein
LLQPVAALLKALLMPSGVTSDLFNNILTISLRPFPAAYTKALLMPSGVIFWPCSSNSIFTIPPLPLPAALAKALLSKPRLIILDEITNAQDQNKEFEMFTNLKNNLKGTTIILISHSNQVSSIVDFLLEIEERKIIVKPARS